MFLVRASFRLADGRRFDGFVTPAPPSESDNLGLIQPHMAVAGAFFGFWGGMFGLSAGAREAFYSAVGGNRDQVFPIAFEVPPDAIHSAVSGEIAGFYKSPDLKEVIVER